MLGDVLARAPARRDLGSVEAVQLGAQLRDPRHEHVAERRHRVKRPHRADVEVAAQDDLVAGQHPDRVDRERKPLQLASGRERGGEIVDDLRRHHDARRLGLAVQPADPEERGQGADVIGVAVGQQDRVDALRTTAAESPASNTTPSSGTASEV